MLKKILLALVGLLVILIVVIATRPGTYHIERSATIDAPAEVVFAKVADFHEWPRWSAWETLDPQMQRTFNGEGVGATYHWSGKHDVGEGQMTLEELRPHERIGIRLDFIKPFKATSKIAFAFAPQAAGTRVTWTMDGDADFLTKFMSLFGSPDAMVGPDFEKGLAGLAKVAIAAADDTTAAPAP